MIRAVIIDNDESSVQFIKTYLPQIQVVKVYASNQFTLKEIEGWQPDLVFMNIHDSSCIHIDLIQYISNHELMAHLVFIKEKAASKKESYVHHDQVKYIMKPYTKKQMDRLMSQIDKDILRRDYPKVQVCLFKYFHIKKNGQTLPNIKWRTAKARELLVYLIQHYGEVVRKDVLVELLWPDISVDKAYDNLYASIYYIRKLLIELEIGIQINTNVHGYEVEFHNVECDVLLFDQLFEEISSDIKLDRDKDIIQKKFNRLRGLYIGEYLEEESYVWKEYPREKCRIQFLSIARKIIKKFADHGKVTDAILLSLDLQKLYPYMDYSYFILMKLYNEYGDIENVERQYSKLKLMLYDEFNTVPNKMIKDWYQEWIQRQYV